MMVDVEWGVRENIINNRDKKVVEVIAKFQENFDLSIGSKRINRDGIKIVSIYLLLES